MAAIQGFLIQYHFQLWVLFMAIISSVIAEVVFRVDPLALLSGTLRTYQKAGCDTEQLSLSCPRGTSISIEVAQYGNTVIDGKPAVKICSTQTNGGIQSGTEIEVQPLENCLSITLQNVVETCQKKSHCKILSSSSNTHDGDPCPGNRKFVEVAYKCRPYEFRSKLACENDVIQLVCNPYSRVAIYSASFGRTEHESIQCSQPPGVKEETCLVSYATETVMDECHGKRRCTIHADSATFGNPCRTESRVYLKVVYTCIPRKVLKERFDYSSLEADEPQQVDIDQNQDELYDEDQFYREFEAIPPAPKLHRELSKSAVLSETPLFFDQSSTSTSSPKESRNINQLEENQEKFYLYLIISVTAGVLVCLFSIIGRFLLQKKRLQKDPYNVQSSNPGDITLPNGFVDDISEIDADIDLTTPLPSVSPCDLNYGTYTFSPSSYGNLGPSNISQTSTTMLFPSNSIISSQQPALIGASNKLLYNPSKNTSLGIMRTSVHYPPLGDSIIGQGTLCRSREYEHTPPRIDADQQYYYG